VVLIRAPSPRIISHTTPPTDLLNSFTSGDAAVSKSGATITYGPYQNIAPSSNDAFLSTYQQPITVHYNYEYPIVEIVDLKRTAEISHWGANLNIEDNIHLRNAGPACVQLSLTKCCTADSITV
jgi:oligosaccharyltransferase complex subunit alpha (ribophorin I)